MKFVILVAAACLAISTAASAQQRSANEQAMGSKLMQEIQAGLSCSAGLIEMRAELGNAQGEIARAKARITELEKMLPQAAPNEAAAPDKKPPE